MKLTETKLAGYNTAIFVPDNYNPAKAYPGVFFFHGNGESGGGTGNIARLYGNGLAKALKDGYNPPMECIVVCPQDNWGGVDGKNVLAILTAAKALYKFDDNNLFLTGLSAGGATCNWVLFNISADVLSMFAAAVVFSPAATYPNYQWERTAKTPVWFLAGAQSGDNGYRDNATNSAMGVNAQVPGLAKITVAQGIGHGGSFLSLYNGTFKDNGVGFWDYLAAHSRKPVIVVPPVDPCAEFKNTITVLKSEIVTLRQANDNQAAKLKQINLLSV